MSRTVLTDGSGRFFNDDSAEAFDEATYFDGHNHISRATGSQWEHERLYRTKGGRWILNAWSQWQGSRETYDEVDNAAAARWLSTQEHEAHKACAAEYAALEVA